MSILKFDELVLTEQLERLSTRERVAFACACAQRLLPTCSTFSERVIGRDDSAILWELLNVLENDLAGCVVSNEVLDEKLHLCMLLIPDENEGVYFAERGIVEGAFMATAYAIRCRKNGESREAAWSARRGYESLFSFVVNSDGIVPDTTAKLQQVHSRNVIQVELSRQQRDIAELVANVVTVNQLLNRSKEEGETLLQA